MRQPGDLKVDFPGAVAGGWLQGAHIGPLSRLIRVPCPAQPRIGSNQTSFFRIIAIKDWI
jgi:hypothetical protein